MFLELLKFTPPNVRSYTFADVNKAIQTGQAAMAIQWASGAKPMEDPSRSSVAGKLGYAVVRSLAHVKSPFHLFHAADCIGDAGAAASAIAACAGARALHQGYARTRGALLCASSDGGLRGAAYLRAADKGK